MFGPGQQQRAVWSLYHPSPPCRGMERKRQN